MGLPHGIGRRRIIPWLRSSSARHGLLLLRRSLIVGCEHGAAAIGELQRVLPQASDDAVHIRDLGAAQTPNIWRANHLLFPRAAIFFRVSCARRDNAADRKRETKRNPSSLHIRILHVSLKAPRSMRRGKVLGQQQNVRATHRNWNLFHPADPLHRSDVIKTSGVRALLVYCADYRCSHSIAISGAAMPGPMIPGCPISRSASPAGYAASAARM